MTQLHLLPQLRSGDRVITLTRHEGIVDRVDADGTVWLFFPQGETRLIPFKPWLIAGKQLNLEAKGQWQ